MRDQSGGVTGRYLPPILVATPPRCPWLYSTPDVNVTRSAALMYRGVRPSQWSACGYLWSFCVLRATTPPTNLGEVAAACGGECRVCFVCFDLWSIQPPVCIVDISNVKERDVKLSRISFRTLTRWRSELYLMSLVCVFNHVI